MHTPSTEPTSPAFGIPPMPSLYPSGPLPYPQYPGMQQPVEPFPFTSPYPNYPVGASADAHERFIAQEQFQNAFGRLPVDLQIVARGRLQRALTGNTPAALHGVLEQLKSDVFGASQKIPAEYSDGAGI